MSCYRARVTRPVNLARVARKLAIPMLVNRRREICSALVIAVLISCVGDRTHVTVAQATRSLGPFRHLDRAWLEMPAEEFARAYAGALIAPYAGYSDTLDTFSTVFLFLDRTGIAGSDGPIGTLRDIISTKEFSANAEAMESWRNWYDSATVRFGRPAACRTIPQESGAAFSAGWDTPNDTRLSVVYWPAQTIRSRFGPSEQPSRLALLLDPRGYARRTEKAQEGSKVPCP